MKRRAWFAQLKPLLWLTIVTSALLTEQPTYTLDILVTSEGNFGPGTLRRAIQNINSGTSDQNSITFAPNIRTISLFSPLPPIEQPTIITGFGAGIDCTQVSPVDNLEAFSAAITVTIDGSQIVPFGTESIAGLSVQADDVTIRGLRITNFTNGNNGLVFGIVTEGNNTLIECCEITAIHTDSTIADNTTAVGIRGNNTTSISRCLVHAIRSANIQAAGANATTGIVIGISSFKEATECRVEDLKSGDIVNHTAGGTPSLVSGLIFGITNIIPSPTTKLCECPTDCQGSECILVQNCIVNCCQTGSIFATEDATVVISEISGIIIDPEEIAETRIDGCTVCNIATGNAHLTDATFSLTIENCFGINASASTTCLRNNTITNVHRGTVALGGINSSAILQFVAGVFSGLGTIIAENNSISTITCQPVTASGVCARITDEESKSPIPECENNLISPSTFTIPICAGMWYQGDTVHMCNNTVTAIRVGKRSALGERSLIHAGYAAGIFTNTSTEVIAHRNTVHDIFGAELVAGPTTRGLFGGTGSKGILLASIAFGTISTIDAQENTIERICEQTLRTTPGIPGQYPFSDGIFNQSEAFLAASQTTGLSIFVSQPRLRSHLIFDVSDITIENNTIKDIAGAVVRGATPGVGTMAIGIAIVPLAKIIPGSDDGSHFDPQQLCLDLQGTITPSLVRGNRISNIWGGTNNTAYGILLDGSNSAVTSLAQFNTIVPQLFSIENNTITNVTGLGIPQPFETTVAPDPCGTRENTSVMFISFPYQPTTGIYTIFGNCSTIAGNTISTITEPSGSARGITTQASNDMNITANTISNVRGYGIFVGGASADIEFTDPNSGLFTPEAFETFFASTRNKIYSNSTFDNTKQGIELGLIDWNGYFHISEVQCGPFNPMKTHQFTPEDSTSIFGNHGQVAPRILNVQCNRDGTITIDFILDSPEQPFTKFVIQFFANKTNSIPHGETHITEFDDPRFVFHTDVHGRAHISTTFTPLTAVTTGDTISAHVTVTTIGQSTSVDNKYKEDTSGFGIKSNTKPCPTVIAPRPSGNSPKPGFASILGR